MKKLLLVINLTLVLALGFCLSPSRAGAQTSTTVGDVDYNNAVNIKDVTLLLNFVFKNVTTLPCPVAADADQNSLTNIQDAIFLLNHIFQPPTGWVWPTLSSCTLAVPGTFNWILDLGST